jgi:hypothetical protein
MLLPEWLKALPTSFAGTAYEPWVQLLAFLLVAAVMLSAIAWVLTRPHVIALACVVLSFLRRVSEALVQASQYAPEAEGYRQRYGRYMMGGGMLAFWVFLFGVFSISLMGIPVYALMFHLARMTPANLVVALLVFFAGLILSRYCLVEATWAWHGLKTGEEFTWPQRRTPWRSP